GTSTLTYVVYDAQTLDAVVIDPVWDYDTASSSLSTHSLDSVLGFLKEKSLKPHYVLETHAHADHVSSSQLFQKIYPEIKVAVGERITEVQETFKTIFNLPALDTEGKVFDLLLNEKDILS